VDEMGVRLAAASATALEVSPSAPGSAAAGSETPRGDIQSTSSSAGAWRCPQPKGVVFKRDDPDADFVKICEAYGADFNAHHGNDSKMDSKVKRLVIFNDNFADRKSTFGSPKTSAEVRPYATDPSKPRCAVGVSSGWFGGKGNGFSTWGSKEQRCVELALDKALLRAEAMGASEILYACEAEDGRTLGTGIFKSSICAEALKGITDGICNLYLRRTPTMTLEEICAAEDALKGDEDDGSASQVAAKKPPPMLAATRGRQMSTML